MNILHVSAVKSWGGGENHIENLCKELQKIAPSTNNSILCIKHGLFEKKLSKTNVSFDSVKLGFKMDPRFFLKLIKICKADAIDLLHIHDSTALTLCIMGDHLYNLPPFIFSKKTSFPIRPRTQTLYKYNYHNIKRILCVSQETKSVAESMINSPEKLKCIYHGTRLAMEPPTDSIDLRNLLNLGNDTLIIGNIANHIWPKDLDTFIKVAHELIRVRNLKNIHFVQIGAYAKITTDLLKKVEECQLTPYISFLNTIPNAKTLIPQFDISLMTSISEGVPQFIYESFLYKVPVVSTNVGGISEIIEDGVNGFLAPAGDSKTLADKIIQLIEKEPLISKFTALSHKKVSENYNTQLMAAKTLQEYKTVLHGQ
ncbi:MAG TPA: glycosyltransferase family 4 protein [Gillisia sp.]|nr:glycosyltransferase family 4 protein [Gillisia sp.]